MYLYLGQHYIQHKRRIEATLKKSNFYSNMTSFIGTMPKINLLIYFNLTCVLSINQGHYVFIQDDLQILLGYTRVTRQVCARCERVDTSFNQVFSQFTAKWFPTYVWLLGTQ